MLSVLTVLLCIHVGRMQTGMKGTTTAQNKQHAFWRSAALYTIQIAPWFHYTITPVQAYYSLRAADAQH